MSNYTSKVYTLKDTDIPLISLSVITTVFHIFGMIVLCCLKSKLNQINILLCLAFSEMIYCLNLVIWPIKALKILRLSLNLFCTLSNKMLMLILLGDRFLGIFLNIRYAIFVTRRKVVYLLSTTWGISGLYGLIPGLLVTINRDYYHLVYYVHSYITLALDSIFTFSAIYTYGYFYCKFKATNRKDSNSRSARSLGGSARNFRFRIPFLIVATYLIFNVSSTIIFQDIQYLRKKHEGRNIECDPCKFLTGIAYVLAVTGFLSDAILYIFMQRNIVRFLRKRVSQVSGTSNN